MDKPFAYPPTDEVLIWRDGRPVGLEERGRVTWFPNKATEDIPTRTAL
jgi:hypothetical protein